MTVNNDAIQSQLFTGLKHYALAGFNILCGAAFQSALSRFKGDLLRYMLKIAANDLGRTPTHAGIQQPCDQLESDQHNRGVEVHVVATGGELPSGDDAGREYRQKDQAIEARRTCNKSSPAHPVEMGAGIEHNGRSKQAAGQRKWP